MDSMLVSKLFAIVHRTHSPTVVYWMEMAVITSQNLWPEAQRLVYASV